MIYHSSYLSHGTKRTEIDSITLPALHRRPVYCWGHKAIPKQTGIVTYALSPNRQRPLANAFYNAIFNTFRRSRAQFWYVVPPFVAAWWLLEWAEHEYVVLLVAGYGCRTRSCHDISMMMMTMTMTMIILVLILADCPPFSLTPVGLILQAPRKGEDRRKNVVVKARNKSCDKRYNEKTRALVLGCMTRLG